MAADQDQKLGMREHSKALLIVTFVSLSSFQYGLDFGIIGGLQAMIGFLQVRAHTQHKRTLSLQPNSPPSKKKEEKTSISESHSLVLKKAQ